MMNSLLIYVNNVNILHEFCEWTHSHTPTRDVTGLLPPLKNKLINSSGDTFYIYIF